MGLDQQHTSGFNKYTAGALC